MRTTANRSRPAILVVGGTGTSGRRVAARLADRGLPVRIASLSSGPAHPTDGVQRALDRPAADFAAFARAVAPTVV